MKSFCRTLLAALALMAAVGEARADILDGLVSYWQFDGDLFDPINGNHGVLEGTDPTLTYDAGMFGQGIDLDGVDQYINVGDDSSLDPNTENGGTGDVSISAWFRVDAFSRNWQAMVSKGEQDAYRIARRHNANVLGYAGGTTDIPTDGDTGPNVNDGLLHHVVAVTEGGVSTALWVDGQLVTTSVEAGHDVPVLETGEELWIGNNPESTGRSWNGLIDDVAIWERPLTEQEIADIWNDGTGATISDLGGFVRGDANDDTAADLVDHSIIGNSYGQDPATRAEGDVDGSGSVDLVDFREWKLHRTDLAATPLAAGVPEPGTIGLALVSLAGMLSLVHRRR